LGHLEPKRRSDVAAWLEKEDFWSYRHALVYSTTIGAIASTGEGPTPRAVLDRVIPDAEARRNVDGPYLHTLMESCPNPSRAAIYGRMVLEASIHRRVWDKAKHLEYVVGSDSAADVAIKQLGDAPR
jgi:replicative DNA helicase